MGNAMKLFGISAVALLCLFSCSKENYSGKSVRISGARSHSGAPLTKTLYSGVTYTEGSDVYERIDWIEGDDIRLAMQNNETVSPVFDAASYSIARIQTPTSKYSVAGLEPISGDGHGLFWGTGAHYFWSGYPASATIGDKTVSGTYPATQNLTYHSTNADVQDYPGDMSIAYMVAGLKTSAPQEYISLDYYPAMTTFDFTVGANTSMVITGFEMETETSGLSENVALCGTFTATFDGNDDMNWTYSASSTGRSITANFSNNITLSTTSKLHFRIFALPLDITGVTIKFIDNQNVTRSLRLKQNDNWITFPACVKANINGLLIPGAVWYINFEGPYVEDWVVNSEVVVGVE